MSRMGIAGIGLEALSKRGVRFDRCFATDRCLAPFGQRS